MWEGCPQYFLLVCTKNCDDCLEYCLKFLDFEEIDLNEVDRVKNILYREKSVRVKLPWDTHTTDYNDWSQQDYDDESEICIEASGVPPGSDVYPVSVPVVTTMQQMYHQVVPPMPNLPPAAYVGTMPPPNMGYSIPQYIYPEERTRRPRSKPSPKRSERRDGPSYPPQAPPVQYSPAYPLHVPMAPTPYQYIPQAAPHIPSAQHATGPPLYLAPAPPSIPVYSTHMYSSYPPVFPAHVPHDDYHESYIEEKNYHEEEEEKPLEKPPSVPINAIKTTAPPSIPVKKQQSSRSPNPVETHPSIPSPATTSPPTPLPTTKSPSPSPAIEEKSPDQPKSWAGLFKGDPPSEATVQRKPPISAVAVSVPPRSDITLKPHQAPVSRQQDNSEEEPLLRSLGEYLSSYQLEHKAIVLTPRGLTNPSNYCYINATLQALLACPAFYNLIKVISQVKDAAGPLPGALPPKSNTPIIDSMIQFIKEFSSAPVNRSNRREKAIWKDKEELDIPIGPAFEPTYVYKMLHALRNETAFQVEGRQEDAEEFLSLLLNGLNDEMLELVKLIEDPKEVPVINGDVTANGVTHNEDSCDWKEVSKGIKNGRITRRAEMGKTPLTEIFRGQLRSRLQRTDVETTDNVQPFFTLQLDIESSDSVTEAIDKYFGCVPVEGAGGGEAWQQHSLEELPNVLILHLKCFHYKQQSCHKIAKALEFPIDLKIDTKLVSNKNKMSAKMRTYKLFAVVYHDGKEASKGHYLADVFHVGFGGWIRYDDSVVRAVTEAALLKPRPPRVPYLLYYKRADTIGQHNQNMR